MSKALLRVGFIGAGGVNFGTNEGPWDHASRVERVRGVVVVGVADPDVGRARRAVDARRRRCETGPSGSEGEFASKWDSCAVYGAVDEMLAQARPDVVFIGLPPVAHGGLVFPKNVEIRCGAAGVHMFIEKPLSVEPPEDVEKVGTLLARQGVVVVVGYMMRYLKAVQHMKKLLQQHGRPVCTISARYNSAYTAIAKPFWWDNDRSGGPIVEQATHFCDLARYFGGDVALETVKAYCISPSEPLGMLSRMPTDPLTGKMVEEGIPESRRIPRATVAIWRFRSGALGSLTHSALLNDTRYSSEFEVWADGLLMNLIDPYTECKLVIRSPGVEETQVLSFKGDDPYMSEDEAFLSAVASGNSDRILSPYSDAKKSYELTWAIRRASESTAVNFLSKL